MPVELGYGFSCVGHYDESWVVYRRSQVRDEGWIHFERPQPTVSRQCREEFAGNCASPRAKLCDGACLLHPGYSCDALGKASARRCDRPDGAAGTENSL